jgi:hypothetical protein
MSDINDFKGTRKRNHKAAPSNTSALRPEPMPSLPAVATSGLPAVISAQQVSTLEKDLLALRRDQDRRDISDEQWEQRRRELLPHWQAFDQPSSRQQIGWEAAKLVGCFPNLANAPDKDVFVEAMCDEIAIEQPTGYELVQACRAVRKKCEFLSIPAVIKELSRMKQMTSRLQLLLDAPNKPSIKSHGYWRWLDAMDWASPRKPLPLPLPKETSDD